MRAKMILLGTNHQITVDFPHVPGENDFIEYKDFFPDWVPPYEEIMIGFDSYIWRLDDEGVYLEIYWGIEDLR